MDLPEGYKAQVHAGYEIAPGGAEDDMSREWRQGINGCCARVKRRGGVERFCAQKAIVTVQGQGYCYYHDPLNPHKFGEGFRVDQARREAEQEMQKA